MNITVIGTGYVGLVTGTVFAELGNSVYGVDINKAKINQLKKGISPIYEPGLDDLISRNIKENRLHFTTAIVEAIKDTQIIFIAVGTPSNSDGSVNLDYVKQAAQDIGKALSKILDRDQIFRVIVNKSTVPIGTGDLVSDIVKKHYSGEFEVVSNPEFLREGQAVADCLKPDRIIIGIQNGLDRAKKIIEELYAPFDCPKLFTDVKTAEMIKYASNAYLATSISFINSIAELCEAVGADVSMVAKGMRLDKRIGKNSFLDAGPGYGGSCFPKDVKGLVDIADQNKVTLPILNATEEVNEIAKNNVIDKVKKMVRTVKNKKIAIWGLAFKPNTDDVREAPVLPLLDYLFKKKARIFAFDPVAGENIVKLYPKIKLFKTPYDCARDADLVVVTTQWDEFKSIDLTKVKKLMKTPRMVDARNIYGAKKMEELGFEYINIGNVQ